MLTIARRHLVRYPNALKRIWRDFEKNPLWTVMRIVGRYNSVRPIAEYFLRRRPRVSKQDDTFFPGLNVKELVNLLRRDGVYQGINLPEDVVRELCKFAMAGTCYANREHHSGFNYLDKNSAFHKYPKPILLGSFFNVAEQCPLIRALEDDPVLLAIAAEYLRSDPIHQGTNMWWSFAVDSTEADRSKAAQLYHIDLDDYRFIKFFFYLTDVDEGAGAHLIVRGTHNRKAWRHQRVLRRVTDEEIERTYGKDKIATIVGPAGTGFVEDTLCFHKGSPPRTRDRLVIQIQYGLRDYGLQHDHADPADLRDLQ